jgi:hypothetical protein
MRYMPPLHLRDHFHLLPDSADFRDAHWRDLPLIWDPRPTAVDPHGSVWAVRKSDLRFRAALDRVHSRDF